MKVVHVISQKVLPWPKTIRKKTLRSNCDWPPCWPPLKKPLKYSKTTQTFFPVLKHERTAPLTTLPVCCMIPALAAFPDNYCISAANLRPPRHPRREAGMSGPACSEPAGPRKPSEIIPRTFDHDFPLNPVESVRVKTAGGNMSAPGSISASSCGRDGANCLHSYAETKPNHQSES